MSQVPTIVDGDFTLFERYPSDLIERAKVHSVLDWHHANLRRGSVGVIMNNVIYPLKGIPSNPKANEEAEKTLEKALTVLETFWLKDGPFLVGRSQPAIADLNLVSEVMALEILSEELHDQILSPYKKVLQWVENTKCATTPHFEEIHGVLFKTKKEFRAHALKSGKNE
ncbi:putative glutathione transferase [Helianthus annuus]|nr:putative glutathione transferase [Helianthus annuus]